MRVSSHLQLQSLSLSASSWSSLSLEWPRGEAVVPGRGGKVWFSGGLQKAPGSEAQLTLPSRTVRELPGAPCRVSFPGERTHGQASVGSPAGS